MKVKFEFDTDNENFDRNELQMHYQACEMAHCINEITDQLRSWYKYDERSQLPTEEVYDKIWDIIQDNINMEKMGY